MSGVAPDGSPVTLYARLPSLGEPELIHAAVPGGAEILELGAGAGRVRIRLIALGHPVVAVDNSEEMLALIDGAETVLADIETLDLGRRFRPSSCSRATSSTTRTTRSGARSSTVCARTFSPDGQVLLQGFPRDWTPSTQWTQHGDRAGCGCAAFTLDGGLVTGEMEYARQAARRHVQAFESKLLSDSGARRRSRVGRAAPRARARRSRCVDRSRAVRS